MSQEKALQTLENLGFTPLDARVYVLLAKKGPQKAGEIAKSLKIPKQTVYFILKNLQKEGIVTSTVERPARFGGVPFERVLDLFVKTKMEEAKRIQRNKDEILLDWKSIETEKKDESSPKFTVIEGRNIIYSKIQQMIQQTNNHFSTITTIPNLSRADSFGLFDAALERQNRSFIKLRFLAELSEYDSDTVRSFFQKASKRKFNFEIRIPDLSLKLSRMAIRDDEEAMFFINASGYSATAVEDDVCLWTDCRDLVHSFIGIFEDSWHNATDIQKKIAEIETGKPSPKTFVIKDADRAHKEYDEITRLAKESIFILTSSTGLVEHWKRNQTEKWIPKGISVRIMAPIMSENLEAARQLMKICEVKHVPESYVETTIVDGQHLFQFKSPKIRNEMGRSRSYFENTIYTDDSEYVEKTENMLNDVWSNAQVPSLIELKAIIQQPPPLSSPASSDVFEEHKKNLKKIVGFSYRMEPQRGTLTEKEILDKMANAIKIPAKDPKRDLVRLYGTQANAVIYPPKNLNLPNFMIFVYHNNRNSSFGVENTMQIHAQMKIAEHESFFPVTFVTDNLRGYKFRNAMHRIRPANEIAYLLKRDELDVQVHGEKLIAGWTVPIPLLPPKYILPPACIIFEGYGKTETYSCAVIGPLNPSLTQEYNMLNAFVTFIHPSSSYHGPGSDGILLRESILTSCPPYE